MVLMMILGWFIKSEGTGFLTSNRKEDNVGSDDIYEVSGLSIPAIEDLTVIIKSTKGNDVLGTTLVRLFMKTIHH